MILVSIALAVPRFAHAIYNGEPADLVLGQLNFTSSGKGTSATAFNAPASIAVDPTTGAVFVADLVNNRILRYASFASLSNGAAAIGVLGQPDFTHSTAATTQSGLNGPSRVMIDSNGSLWVADAYNNRVLRFDNVVSQANGANADGVLGQIDFTHSVSATTPSGMAYPYSVVVDGNGVLWVADGNNSRVLRFDNAANKVNGANADGVLGQATFASKLTATTQSGMNIPGGVAVDSTGTLWVSDTSNNRVLRFDNAASKANGANADGVLGEPTFGQNYSATTIQASMNFPEDLTVDPTTQSLYVADASDNRVLRFDNPTAKANGANADWVIGQSNFTASAPGTTQTSLHTPIAVAVSSEEYGSVWVADYNNNRVLHFPYMQYLVSTPTFTPTASPTSTTTATLTPTSTATLTSTATATLIPARIDSIGIYRGNTSFYLRLHNTTGAADLSAMFNPASVPFPIVGDWTNAGFDSIGVYDRSIGRFYLRNTISAGTYDETLVFGNPNDTPLSDRWTSSATHAGVVLQPELQNG